MINEYKVSENEPIKDVKAQIFLKENSVPKYLKARQVPLAHKELVNDALDKLVRDGIIEPVAYSDWAFPIVPVLKANGSMRICADFKLLNGRGKFSNFPSFHFHLKK